MATLLRLFLSCCRIFYLLLLGFSEVLPLYPTSPQFTLVLSVSITGQIDLPRVPRSCCDVEEVSSLVLVETSVSSTSILMLLSTFSFFSSLRSALLAEINDPLMQIFACIDVINNNCRSPSISSKLLLGHASLGICCSEFLPH